MTETPEPVRPQLLHGGRSPAPVDTRVATAATDPRVSMVLAVLGGSTVDEVARRWEIDSSLLHRGVRDFLVAGSAAVTNRPEPDVAR